jgi:hypothetical protein
LPPETQDAYVFVTSSVMAPLAGVKFPVVCGSGDTHPSPPCWATVAEQLHPPPVALVQVTDE